MSYDTLHKPPTPAPVSPGIHHTPTPPDSPNPPSAPASITNPLTATPYRMIGTSEQPKSVSSASHTSLSPRLFKHLVCVGLEYCGKQNTTNPCGKFYSTLESTFSNLAVI